MRGMVPLHATTRNPTGSRWFIARTVLSCSAPMSSPGRKREIDYEKFAPSFNVHGRICDFARS